MEYTRAQMIRDLMVPIGIMAILAVGWLGISYIESAASGRPLWDCFFKFACGTLR